MIKIFAIFLLLLPHCALFCQQKIFESPFSHYYSLLFVTNDSISNSLTSVSFEERDIEKFQTYDFSKFKNVRSIKLSFFKDSAFRIMLKKIEAMPQLELVEITNLPLVGSPELNKRSDSFPSSIQNLKKLKTLQLVWLKGYDWEDIINKISSVPNLENLKIRIAFFETFPSNYKRLSFLQGLALEGLSQLNELPDLSSFPRLKYLDVGGNPKVNYEHFFNKLASVPLKELRIQNGTFQSLPPSVETLKYLTHFTADFIKLQDQDDLFGILSKLPLLKYLRLRIDSLALTESIQNLQSLETLDIDNNKIHSFPQEIGNLKKLKTISFEANSIQRLPVGFFNLISLEEINASFCKLEEIQKDLGKLSGLKKLNLSRNQLEKLPEEIGELKKLQLLLLNDNKISILPLSITNCTSLQQLNIANNRIEELPEQFGKITSLKSFTANNNQLKRLPESFGNLYQLQTLLLANNEINNLPLTFTQLKRLKSLNLSGNVIHRLPEDIGNLQSLQEFQLNSPSTGVKVNHSLTNIPASFRSLVNLKLLTLTNLPKLNGNEALLIIQQLKGVTDRVSLVNCNISELPVDGWESCKIKSLDLEGNKISSIPINIIKAPFLSYLRLRKNPLPPALEFSFDSKEELILALMEEGIIKDSSLITGTPAMCRALLTSANLGFIYRKEYRKFVHYYSIAERKCPNIIESNDWRYGDLGISQYYTGDYLNAITNLSYALKKDTSSSMRIMNFIVPEFDILTKAYLAKKDTAGAMNVYENWANSFHNSTAATMLGIFHLSKKNLNEADKWFTVAANYSQLRNSPQPLAQLSILEIFVLANKKDSVKAFVQKTDSSKYNIGEKLLYEYLLAVHNLVNGDLTEQRLQTFLKKMQEIPEQKIGWSYDLFEYWLEQTITDDKINGKILSLHKQVKSKLHS